MEDLKLVSTDDLVAELLSRHDHAVFMGVKIKSYQPGQETKEELASIDSLRRWIGNSYTCAGLCSSLSKSILNDFSEREQPLEKGDY